MATTNIFGVLSIIYFCLQITLAQHQNCEPLRVPLCDGLQYNTTIMPNFLNQQTQEDASMEVHAYYPLIKVNCSADLQAFLCSIYAPKCNNLGAPIPPCKYLCQSAKNGCSTLMSHFGVDWPEHFDCDKFPNPGNGYICFDKVSF